MLISLSVFMEDIFIIVLSIITTVNIVNLFLLSLTSNYNIFSDTTFEKRVLNYFYTVCVLYTIYI